MASTFLYSTVWVFLEPDEVIARFDEMVQDANVRCTYMPNEQMFRIEVPEPGYESNYAKFIDICNDYIDKHQTGPLDAMSDPKIIRSAETGGDTNPEDELDELLREDESMDDELLIDVGSDEHEDDDKSFWSPKNPSTNVALVMPDGLLRKVAHDTVCSLKSSVEKACVFITNATASKLQTVTKKLDNIERNSHRPRIVSHFMRMEKERDAMLQLHRLQHLRDGTLLQTLVSKGEEAMLPRQRVVRLMRLDAGGRPFVFSTPPSNYAHDARLVLRWAAMRFPHFPREGMHASLVGYVGSSVEGWLQETIDSVTEEGDLMSGDIGVLPDKKVLVPTVAPLRQQAGRPVQDLGFPEETDFESRPNSSLHIDAEIPDSGLLIDYEGRPTSLSQASLPVEPIHTPAPGSIDVNSTYSSAATERLQSTMPSGIKFTDRLPKASWDVAPARPVPCDYRIERLPDYAGNNAAEPFPPLGSQGPRPRVQRLQSSSRTTLVGPPGLPTQLGQYSQVMQDKPEEITDVVETLQVNDEVASRKYFNTTAHRKPKSKGKGKASNPSFKAELDLPEWDPRSNKQPTKSVQDQASASRGQVPPAPQAKPLVLPDCSNDLLQILDYARAFTGHLDMEISIGRILIEGLRGPEAKKFADSKPMSSRRMAEGIKEYLSSDEPSRVFFVERLTSSTVEACQIPTPHLFNQDPASIVEECWYEFRCECKGGEHLVIKVKGPDDSETKLVPDTIGQAFFHYPKRKWDACFAAKGREPYTRVEAVSKFLEKLSAEVRDSKDGQLVDLRFQVTSGLKILSAYTKKRLSFEYIHNDRITLHLTEVQDLYRSWMRGNTSLHQFASGERSEMIATGRLWFEAKLSVSAKSFFNQNLETSTGDDAAWNAKDVLDDKTLRDIQKVVDNVVIRMDGVGVQNKGSRGSKEDMDDLEAWEQKNKKTVPANYW